MILTFFVAAITFSIVALVFYRLDLKQEREQQQRGIFFQVADFFSWLAAGSFLMLIFEIVKNIFL